MDDIGGETEGKRREREREREGEWERGERRGDIERVREERRYI